MKRLLLLVAALSYFIVAPPNDESVLRATFGIHIWTWKRLDSLKRLVASLQTSHFTCQSQNHLSIDLIFHIDGQPDPEIPLWILSHFQGVSFIEEFSQLDLDYYVQEDHRQHNKSENLQLSWSYGSVLIDLKQHHLGIPGAIFEGSSINSMYWQHDYCILLEDDVAVSAYFWDWIQFSFPFLQGKDPFEPFELVENSTTIIGASLYVPRLNEMRLNRKDFEAWSPSDMLRDYGQNCCQSLFTYEVPSSWGSLLPTYRWMEATKYYKERTKISEDISILPEGILAKFWKNSWKKIMMEFIYLKKYVYLYPSTFNEQSYATNFMESGVHYQPGPEESTTSQLRTWFDGRYTVPLIGSSKILQSIQQEFSKKKHICHVDMYLVLDDDQLTRIRYR